VLIFNIFLSNPNLEYLKIEAIPMSEIQGSPSSIVDRNRGNFGITRQGKVGIIPA
jgi:hypothetical protein